MDYFEVAKGITWAHSQALRELNDDEVKMKRDSLIRKLEQMRNHVNSLFKDMNQAQDKYLGEIELTQDAIDELCSEIKECGEILKRSKNYARVIAE